MIQELFVGDDFFEVTLNKNCKGKTLADLCQEIEARQIEAGEK